MMDPGMLSLLNVTEADIMKDLPSKNRVVVLDIGSSMVKAGFSGETKPSCVFPTSTAIQGGYVEESNMPCLMETASVQTPLQRNSSDVFNLEESTLEAIFNFTLLKALGIRSTDYSVLVTQSFLGYSRNKEKVAQLLFEKFLSPSCVLITNNELSLYASGRVTGIAMEIGASDSHCIPMKDGYPLVGFITRSEVTGNALTERLNELLTSKGYPAFEKHILEDIKMKMCKVSTNLFMSLSESEEEKYYLPDGTEIRIGKERYQCPEIMFNPIMAYKPSLSICSAICEAIESVEVLFGKQGSDVMYKNIVLSGGSANLANLGERMTAEINKCKKRDSDVRVTVVEDGAFSAYRGGSLISSHSLYPKFTFNRDEYLEHGINALYCKT